MGEEAEDSSDDNDEEDDNEDHLYTHDRIFPNMRVATVGFTIPPVWPIANGIGNGSLDSDGINDG